MNTVPLTLICELDDVPCFRPTGSNSPSSLLKNLEIESFSYFDRSLLGRHGGVGCNFEAGVGRILPRWWLSGKQFGNADQVIGDQIEQEVGGDASDAAMLGLAHGAMLLAPAEDALDHGSA